MDDTANADDTAESGGTVQIGAAAALFDLPASTLRWWELAGVLARPVVEGGRRRYQQRDLRRIGLAYLCHVAGMMPLSATATVTSADHGHLAWQHAVRAQIDRLDRQRERIDAAHRQLRHLLQCVDDDPAADCPFLAAELRANTPRGRVADVDLLQAARNAGRTRSTGEHRAAPMSNAERPDRSTARSVGDESTARSVGDERYGDGRGRDESSAAAGVAMSLHCLVCPEPLASSGRGRPRRYCSAACRQRAYRSRRPEPTTDRRGLRSRRPRPRTPGRGDRDIRALASFQAAHLGQAISDVTYSRSRPRPSLPVTSRAAGADADAATVRSRGDRRGTEPGTDPVVQVSGVGAGGAPDVRLDAM